MKQMRRRRRRSKRRRGGEKEIVMKVGAIFEIEWEFSVAVNTHTLWCTHTYTKDSNISIYMFLF